MGKYFDTGWVKGITPVTNQIDTDKVYNKAIDDMIKDKAR